MEVGEGSRSNDYPRTADEIFHQCDITNWHIRPTELKKKKKKKKKKERKSRKQNCHFSLKLKKVFWQQKIFCHSSI